MSEFSQIAPGARQKQFVKSDGFGFLRKVLNTPRLGKLVIFALTIDTSEIRLKRLSKTNFRVKSRKNENHFFDTAITDKDKFYSAGNYMFKVKIETLEEGLKYVQS